MNDFRRDGRGAAVQWFAVAAVVLSAASMAGAHTLNWLSRSGRVALVAYRAPAPEQPRRAFAGADVDTMPTGSIPSSASSPGAAPSTALMIRIR